MKFFTKNLIWFSICLFILTIGLRYGLSTMLADRMFTAVWFLAAGYAIIVFVAGYQFGRKDNENLPLFDIGFRFHLATYIICNAIAEGWLLLGFQSQYEQIRSVHLTALFWGLALLVHFIIYLVTRRHAIRGIHREELFE